jgi:hypothetical protein
MSELFHLLIIGLNGMLPLTHSPGRRQGQKFSDNMISTHLKTLKPADVLLVNSSNNLGVDSLEKTTLSGAPPPYQS